MIVREGMIGLHSRHWLHVSFIILYLVIGYLIDIAQERRSLDYFRLPPIERHFFLLYPLYLLCRTQCMILYLISILIPYQAGSMLLFVSWRYTIRYLMTSIPSSIAIPVIREYMSHVKYHTFFYMGKNTTIP